MLLLFRVGVMASFMVYQTVKIWQAATLHNFLRSGRNVFQESSYLEEVDEALLNDHVWGVGGAALLSR